MYTLLLYLFFHEKNKKIYCELKDDLLKQILCVSCEGKRVSLLLAVRLDPRSPRALRHPLLVLF